jgi:membrane protein implicated in regulation of membrane protease activity
MEWWAWTALGLALVAIKVLTPGGLFALFLALAAIGVSVFAALDAGEPLWLQVLLFSVFSIASLLLLRGPLQRWLGVKGRNGALMDSLVGEVATLMEELSPQATGKAELRGTVWSVRNGGDQPLRQGQRCRVSRVDGLTLWVNPE